MNQMSMGLMILLVAAPLDVAAYEEYHHERTGTWALDADVSWLPVAGESDPPRDFTAPVNVQDLPLATDLQPFGVVRSSMDSPDVGHSGIDLRMEKDRPLRAVADGMVIAVTPVEERPEESEVVLLLTTGPRQGTGWGFVYAHVRPAPGIVVGQGVKRGTLIATSIYSGGFSVHLELSYRFNDYLYTSHQICWVDRLRVADQQAILNWFDRLRNRPAFTEAWEQTEFGSFPFRALLDSKRFPEGPKMCYYQGTDVR
jgi:murein DD-endopeptidase MepM/ murein hydrolase activator NlpD